MKSKSVRNMVLAAMFLAIGLVLPFFTMQLKTVGKMLLPMHIPVYLCGLLCGWQYGFCVGLIMPLMRSLLFGMPVMYPSAAAMAAELATYGLVAGWLYFHAKRQGAAALYGSLVAAMLCGRIVWGLAEIILLGIKGSSFTWEMFAAGAFGQAIPGILLQLVLIPALMFALDKTGVRTFRTA